MELVLWRKTGRTEEEQEAWGPYLFVFLIILATAQLNLLIKMCNCTKPRLNVARV